MFSKDASIRGVVTGAVLRRPFSKSTLGKFCALSGRKRGGAGRDAGSALRKERTV